MSDKQFNLLSSQLTHIEDIFSRHLKMVDEHHYQLEQQMLEVFEMKFDNLSAEIRAETADIRRRTEAFEKALATSDKMLYSHERRIGTLEAA